MTIRAEPFTNPALDVEKFSRLVEDCARHRPWFHDYLWHDLPKRREAVIAYLADGFNNGKLWEVWRDADLVGILLLNEVVPFIDARCHFLFFDDALADKRQLCLNLMGWAFEHIPVETLRVELPTYARALLKYVRKLGFRFEGELRPFSWPQDADQLDMELAKLGSRKHRATLYDGVWHDMLLLSVTKDEFAARRALPNQSPDQAPNGAAPAKESSDGRPDHHPRPELDDRAPALAHGAGVESPPKPFLRR